MKSNVQQPQRIENSLQFLDLRIDKFACVFFILGSVLCALFLHRFII